ncbi:MAG TPA: hypothetical protein DEP72_07010 [Clostridiales bacterium]|nr:MAG: hypothetical protein A2Y18_07890 [Clostridiales bacterium GWD2_32_19]HCC07890.1 hypothetical protein [Clostridiales bacterium]
MRNKRIIVAFLTVVMIINLVSTMISTVNATAWDFIVTGDSTYGITAKVIVNDGVSTNLSSTIGFVDDSGTRITDTSETTIKLELDYDTQGNYYYRTESLPTLVKVADKRINNVQVYEVDAVSGAELKRVSYSLDPNPANQGQSIVGNPRTPFGQLIVDWTFASPKDGLKKVFASYTRQDGSHLDAQGVPNADYSAEITLTRAKTMTAFLEINAEGTSVEPNIPTTVNIPVDLVASATAMIGGTEAKLNDYKFTASTSPVTDYNISNEIVNAPTDGSPVVLGRTMHVAVPAMAPGGTRYITITATVIARSEQVRLADPTATGTATATATRTIAITAGPLPPEPPPANHAGLIVFDPASSHEVALPGHDDWTNQNGTVVKYLVDPDPKRRRPPTAPDIFTDAVTPIWRWHWNRYEDAYYVQGYDEDGEEDDDLSYWDRDGTPEGVLRYLPATVKGYWELTKIRVTGDLDGTNGITIDHGDTVYIEDGYRGELDAEDRPFDIHAWWDPAPASPAVPTAADNYKPYRETKYNPDQDFGDTAYSGGWPGPKADNAEEWFQGEHSRPHANFNGDGGYYNIDTVDPTPTIASTNSEIPERWYGSSVHPKLYIKVTQKDDRSGIYEGTVTDTVGGDTALPMPITDFNTASRVTSTQTRNTVLNSTGIHKIINSVEDYATNAKSIFKRYGLDNVKPKTSISIESQEWTKVPFNIVLTFYDKDSGLDKWGYSLVNQVFGMGIVGVTYQGTSQPVNLHKYGQGTEVIGTEHKDDDFTVPINTDGIYTLTENNTVDVVGNTKTGRIHGRYKYDHTPPTAVIIPGPSNPGGTAFNTNVWYGGTVNPTMTIKGNASDNLSGIHIGSLYDKVSRYDAITGIIGAYANELSQSFDALYEDRWTVQEKLLTFTTTGIRKIFIDLEDYATNVTNITMEKFALDVDNPTVVITPEPNPVVPPTLGWTNIPIIVNIAATDSDSGLYKTQCDLDNISNRYLGQHERSEGAIKGPSGQGVVALGSEIRSGSQDFTIDKDGIFNVIGSAEDAVGNVSNASKQPYKYDHTHPGIKLQFNNSVYFNNRIEYQCDFANGETPNTITAEVGDNISGVMTFEYAVTDTDVAPLAGSTAWKQAIWVNQGPGSAPADGITNEDIYVGGQVQKSRAVIDLQEAATMWEDLRDGKLYFHSRLTDRAGNVLNVAGNTDPNPLPPGMYTEPTSNPSIDLTADIVPGTLDTPDEISIMSYSCIPLFINKAGNDPESHVSDLKIVKILDPTWKNIVDSSKPIYTMAMAVYSSKIPSKIKLGYAVNFELDTTGYGTDKFDNVTVTAHPFIRTSAGYEEVDIYIPQDKYMSKYIKIEDTDKQKYIKKVRMEVAADSDFFIIRDAAKEKYTWMYSYYIRPDVKFVLKSKSAPATLDPSIKGQAAYFVNPQINPELIVVMDIIAEKAYLKKLLYTKKEDKWATGPSATSYGVRKSTGLDLILYGINKGEVFWYDTQNTALDDIQGETEWNGN